jgi:hypothetical protein
MADLRNIKKLMMAWMGAQEMHRRKKRQKKEADPDGR